ncbi:patatin-like protein 3 [Cucumis melo var. makuwa]|uniref:Patatin n=2 Tax=Cucumis melo var. makuwa TaxID=1194695 RepID=A0A5D3CPR3_CUCMM|nr:patatin-like protein 3 [Cucumis melo var. makuwa]TYK13372.1 patatin-like protein 3 [Cucumis melo var. makuwa]
MAAVASFPQINDIDSMSFNNVDKLTYEIFSILENNFLFGCDDSNQKLHVAAQPSLAANAFKSGKHNSGKVRILSIDGGGSTDGILAAKSLTYLEDFLRRKSGKPDARIADYFDVVAGSGAGGILAALLFTKGKDGYPLFTADGALNFLIKNRREIFRSSDGGIFRRVFRPAKVEKLFRKTFGECTLKDTLKSVLIPCYDLSTRAPFLFSRADAHEMDGYDFKIRDICIATSAEPTVSGAVQMSSVDKRTKIAAVDGGIAMNNPTAAAITHVLNNKQEFPFCNSVEDLLVVSLGNGESDFSAVNLTSSPASFTRIAGEGASDVVDQAVSMAFGPHRTTNYIRIQGNGIVGGLEKGKRGQKMKRINILEKADEMLTQKNIEAVLFKGKKMIENTNLEKLEVFAGEVIKEEERRKSSILPTVLLKQAAFPSPRTSSASATTLSTISSC